MNILIYGAGVLGSLYASRLKESGQIVSILARGQRFDDLRKHGIEIQPWGRKLNLDLLDPEGLMEYHNARMFALSRSNETSARLDLGLKSNVSPTVMAGIQYTLLTQKCIIADPSPDERMMIALGAIQQKECYPCLIVSSRDGRIQWLNKIRELLPDDVQVLDACDALSSLRRRAILFVEHAILEKQFQLPSFPKKDGKGGTALIVDEAHLYKNSDARRTQNLLAIWKGVSYRLLLTDYPVDLSYTDLRVLLRILDRETDFEDLYDALYTASRDPLVNATRNLGYGYQTILRRLHFKLRATCMLRRCDDRELDVQERVVDIPLSNGFPEGLNPEEINQVYKKVSREYCPPSDMLAKFPLTVNDLKTFYELADNFIRENPPTTMLKNDEGSEQETDSERSVS